MTPASAGLTEQEAGRRLAADGPNELPAAGPRRLWQIALEILREPMFGLLLAGGAVYAALGDLVSGVVLLAFASLSVSISIVQEIRSEKVLDALRAMTSPRALVMRDGRSRRIPGREVVRGDVVLVAEGNRIPADGVLLEARELLVDESMLTGESVAVAKRARGSDADGANMRPGGENIPAVFSGSLVVRGTGVVLIQATGAATEIGRIGKSLASIDAATPRLSLETRRLVRLFAVGGLLASVAVIVTYGLLRGSWLDAALAGIAVGMARARGLHDHGRVANLAGPRADAPGHRHRDAGGRHGPVHRQDRHPHAQPDDGPGVRCRGRVGPRAAPAMGRAGLRAGGLRPDGSRHRAGGVGSDGGPLARAQLCPVGRPAGGDPGLAGAR